MGFRVQPVFSVQGLGFRCIEFQGLGFKMQLKRTFLFLMIWDYRGGWALLHHKMKKLD